MDLEQWRARLNGSELPVFARTVKDVGQVATSARSSARDLSEVLSRDASMVTRLLRIANSPLFNPHNKPVDTISAAVVLIGFDGVRDLAVSVSLIEKMVAGDLHVRVATHLAQAFHAAAQAKSFSQMAGVAGSEEVFVAGLLKDVGVLAFWSEAAGEAAAIEARCAAGERLEDAQTAVLGFPIDELSAALAEDWQLGDLVRYAAGNKEEHPCVSEIRMAHNLAQQVTTYGWENEQVERCLLRIAAHLDVDENELREVVSENFDSARNIAAGFGIERLEAAFPPAPVKAETHPVQPAPAVDHAIPEPIFADAANDVQADMARTQIAWLSQIAQGVAEQQPRDALMQQVMQGLVASLGLAHADFALLDPGEDRVRIKYSAPGSPQAGDIVVRGVLEAVMSQIEPTPLAQGGELWPGGADFAGRVTLSNKAVGLVACRLPPGAPATQRHLAGLTLFLQQAVLVLLQTEA
ncbi:MAG: HDOD domain-containing protein [Pseudomonadota bacterium]